ncbi:MAG: HD domain-containing protein [Desulfatibacillaceae bacterium]
MKDGADAGAAMHSVTDRVRQRARELFARARASHDWEHTERVARLCARIGPAEGADMEVLLCAAYLHDVGRPYEDAARGGLCHAQRGAEIAEQVLADLPMSGERRTNVIHCVRTHRFRGNAVPETTEARVLFDADKLDSIGAIGIARAYLFAGEVGARLHNSRPDVENTEAYSEEDTGYREYRVKLRRVVDRVLTAEGRRMAQDRHRYMEEFFQRFLEEHEAKR